MKKSLILFGLVLAAAAFAGSIKTWSTGDTLRTADLNSNFQHIHNTMVGGHGARLVDADVSATAAIAHSKLASPALVPKAWGATTGVCGAGTCGIAASSGVTSVTWSSTGIYNITLSYTPTDANYAVLITSSTDSTYCIAFTKQTAAPQITVRCRSDANAVTNVDMNFLVLD